MLCLWQTQVTLAESAATVVERCFVYPLDKLRTRLQIDPTKHASLMSQAVVVTGKTWMEGFRPAPNEVYPLSVCLHRFVSARKLTAFYQAPSS